MIESVLSAARDAGLGPLIVVVGRGGDAVGERVEASALAPDTVVLNRRFAEGIGGSAAAGVGAAMTTDVDAAAILLADEPGVHVDAIRRVVEHWNRVRLPAVRAVYSDRPGHPVVLSRSVFGLVAGLPPSASVLAELVRADREVGSVMLTSTAPIDVDTAQDYERALRRSRPAPSELSETPRGDFALRGSPRR